MTRTAEFGGVGSAAARLLEALTRSASSVREGDLASLRGRLAEVPQTRDVEGQVYDFVVSANVSAKAVCAAATWLETLEKEMPGLCRARLDASYCERGSEDHKRRPDTVGIVFESGAPSFWYSAGASRVSRDQEYRREFFQRVGSFEELPLRFVDEVGGFRLESEEDQRSGSLSRKRAT